MTSVLIKRGIWRQNHTEGDEGRDQRDASTPEGMAEIASKPPVAWEEELNQFFLTTLRRSQYRGHLDLGLLACRTGRQQISVVQTIQSVELYYASKLMHRANALTV